MKTILIIGAHGFIGKKLRKKLNNKFLLICPSKKKLDITNFSSLNKYFKKKIDIVLNLSGQISSNNQVMKKVIVKGNKNILKAVINSSQNTEVYLFSSTLVYGHAKKYVSKKARYKPIDSYSRYKVLAEKVYLKSNINYKILRVSHVYDENKKGIIKNLIKSTIDRKKIILPNLNMNRNFIHLIDLVALVEKIILKKTKKKIFDIENENFTIKKIIYIIEKYFNLKIDYLDKKMSLKSISSQKIKKSNIFEEVNYKPKVMLKKFIISNIKNAARLS